MRSINYEDEIENIEWSYDNGVVAFDSPFNEDGSLKTAAQMIKSGRHRSREFSRAQYRRKKNKV